jgi:hypothetical protein
LMQGQYPPRSMLDELDRIGVRGTVTGRFSRHAPVHIEEKPKAAWKPSFEGEDPPF